MNSRERILAALRRDPVDRIPWTTLIDGYYLSSLKENKNQVDAIIDFGGDVFARHIPTYKEVVTGVSSNRTVFGSASSDKSNDPDPIIQQYTAGGDVRHTIENLNGNIKMVTETPVGNLTGRWLLNEITPFIPFPMEHQIKTIEDLRVYRYIIENAKHEETYDVFRKEDAYIGDHGIASTTTPTSPLHWMLDECGVENFYYLLNDYTDEVEEIMEIMHEESKKIFKIIAASPALVAIDYENTSTTTMSPTMYELYSEQQINDYADILHNSGKILLTHMCGKLKGLEQQLRRGRMDGIVDIAPPPTGDCTLAEAVKMWGSDKLIMGGIDATAFVNLNPDQITAYVKEILENVGDARGVFLCSGDATPQHTPLENLQAITDAVIKYGTYN